MLSNDTQGGEQHKTSPEKFNGSNGPRIYVASLSDYNNGCLHGEWLDAAQSGDDLHGEISRMLEQSEDRLAEEWAIHDYEGFFGVQLGEFEPINRVSLIARNIAEHGLAYAHWAQHVGTDDDSMLEEFGDHYLGRWPSAAEYAEDILNELGAEDAIKQCVPGHLQHYVTVDGASYARDLVLSGEIWSSDSQDGGVHIFDAHS